MTIGRSKSNGIFLDSEKVSDIHAKVFYRDGQYWVEDLNSRLGTWVNGTKVAPGDEASLGKQSEIIVGDVSLNFQGYE
jgi:pSer/pThr/pTyr-binding forkhead associated (FHA) protein